MVSRACIKNNGWAPMLTITEMCFSGNKAEPCPVPRFPEGNGGVLQRRDEEEEKGGRRGAVEAIISASGFIWLVPRERWKRLALRPLQRFLTSSVHNFFLPFLSKPLPPVPSHPRFPFTGAHGPRHAPANERSP